MRADVGDRPRAEVGGGVSSLFPLIAIVATYPLTLLVVAVWLVGGYDEGAES